MALSETAQSISDCWLIAVLCFLFSVDWERGVLVFFFYQVNKICESWKCKRLSCVSHRFTNISKSINSRLALLFFIIGPKRVSYIDTRNKAHFAESNWQFIWAACNVARTTNTAVPFECGKQETVSFDRRRSEERLNPTYFANGTQNFR